MRPRRTSSSMLFRDRLRWKTLQNMEPWILTMTSSSTALIPCWNLTVVKPRSLEEYQSTKTKQRVELIYPWLSQSHLLTIDRIMSPLSSPFHKSTKDRITSKLCKQNPKNKRKPFPKMEKSHKTLLFIAVENLSSRGRTCVAVLRYSVTKWGEVPPIYIDLLLEKINFSLGPTWHNYWGWLVSLQ